jgi:glycosyltransferase involved in cell wall biosynthesis
MRILVVTAHHPPDFVSGATLQVERLALGTARAGHDVTVLSGAIAAGLADGESRTEQRGPVTIRWLGTATRILQDDDGNWLNEHACAEVASLLDHWQPDVVHAHALQTLGADLLAAATARGVPTVLTMHDMWWWCSRLFLVDRDLQPCPRDTTRSDCACARSVAWRRRRGEHLAVVLDGVDQILVPSHAMRRLVVANGLSPHRVDVDENDVGEAAESAVPSHAPAPGDAVRFLYVGGDSPLKGRDVVLDAARSLRRTRGWTLRCHGVPRPARRWSQASRHVEFRAPYHPSRTAEVMGAADVLVIPSIARESFSLAAREALSAGLAVVTSDCGGPEEVVEDGRNGLIVPTGDVRALAAAMGQLVANRALLGRLREAARADPPPLRRTDEHVAALVERYLSLGRKTRPGDRAAE